ncbi:MAG: hypothetical protein JJT94_16990, partial [Bernardetiaceae bacterium]|nr:hypothetical protein [Bernardetiaceae bacterium]
KPFFPNIAMQQRHSNMKEYKKEKKISLDRRKPTASPFVCIIDLQTGKKTLKNLSNKEFMTNLYFPLRKSDKEVLFLNNVPKHGNKHIDKIGRMRIVLP